MLLVSFTAGVVFLYSLLFAVVCLSTMLHAAEPCNGRAVGPQLAAGSPFYSWPLYYAKNSGLKCVIWHNPLTKIELEFIMFYMPKQASVGDGNMRALAALPTAGRGRGSQQCCSLCEAGEGWGVGYVDAEIHNELCRALTTRILAVH